MNEEKKVIVVSLGLTNLFQVASALLLIFLAAWIIAYDHNITYLWVLPLDSARELFTYFKSDILVNIYNVVDNYRSIVGLTGITGRIIIASSGDYSIIVARGLNTYVSTIAVLTPILYVFTLKKTRKLIDLKKTPGLIMSVVLLILFILPLISLFIYINTGFTNGYSFAEEPVRTLYFRDLNYAVVNVTGSTQYVYIINDEVGNALTLVAFKVSLHDQVLPIVALDVITPSGKYSELTYAKSLYLINSSLNITVISPAPLVNTTLTYYKASFKELSTEAPILILLLPVSMLVFGSILSLIASRILEKYKMGIKEKE